MYFRNINVYELKGSHAYAQSKFRIWEVSKTHTVTEPGKCVYFEIYFVIYSRAIERTPRALHFEGLNLKIRRVVQKLQQF